MNIRVIDLDCDREYKIPVNSKVVNLDSLLGNYFAPQTRSITDLMQRCEDALTQTRLLLDECKGPSDKDSMGRRCGGRASGGGSVGLAQEANVGGARTYSHREVREMLGLTDEEPDLDDTLTYTQEEVDNIFGRTPESQEKASRKEMRAANRAIRKQLRPKPFWRR